MEQLRKEIAYRPKITWDAVKKSGDPFAWGRFILQEGLVSSPDMAASILALPTYALARAGELAEERARNDGRTDVTGADLLVALPIAGGSALLERSGTRAILGIGAQPARSTGARITRAGMKEGATEAGQAGVEYLGTTVGTKREPTYDELMDRMLSGAVAGAPFGAAGRGSVETMKAAVRRAGQVSIESADDGAVSRPQRPEIRWPRLSLTAAEIRNLSPSDRSRFTDRTPDGRFLLDDFGSSDLLEAPRMVAPGRLGEDTVPVRITREDTTHVDTKGVRAAARALGYVDGLHMALDVAANWTELRWSENHPDRVLALVRNGGNRLSVIEMIKSKSGDFYKIITAGTRFDHQVNEWALLRSRGRSSDPNAGRSGPFQGIPHP